MQQKVNIVKVKPLYFNSIVPKKMHESDVGFDVYANSCKYDPFTDSYIYGTGIAIEMPDHIFCDARARSSLYKTECYIPNGIGTIDNGYRGEITFIYKPRTSNKLIEKLRKIIYSTFNISLKDSVPPFEIGDRIGQLVFLYKPSIELVTVEELNDSDRGYDGFGSTGNK